MHAVILLQDVEAGMVGAQLIPCGDKGAQINACVANIKAQMEADRKTTSLKHLQGLIWTGGYRSGAIRAQLFRDVPDVLQQMRDQGIKTYIYSSGSRRAQRDLLAHTQVWILFCSSQRPFHRFQCTQPDSCMHFCDLQG